MMEESEEAEQVRISLVLSPEVTDRSLNLPSDPIAVPSSIRRRGLSAIVNHLLDRHVESTEVDEKKDDITDENQSTKLPEIPFDFIIQNKLLRVSVDTAVRRESLSLEDAIIIQYFPAYKQPKDKGSSKAFPDWISAMSFAANQQEGVRVDRYGFLCTGSYDGSIHVYSCEKNLTERAMVKPHIGPVKCLSSIEHEGKILIATGSKDQKVLTHVFDPKEDNDFQIRAHTACNDGHFNSVESISFQRNNNGEIFMASGDWDGGLSLWNLPMSNDNSHRLNTTKKQKTQVDSDNQEDDINIDYATIPQKIQPMSSWKAHISSVSAIAWGHTNGASEIDSTAALSNNIISASWDHSLKVWDPNREDCLLTLNGSRVISCMNRCMNLDVVATGHPDCTVRLWDMRTGKDHTGGTVWDSTFKPSHKAWISSLQWSPQEPYVLATNSHDGYLKMWDIRSSLPLHSVRAHPKGEKGLCVAYGTNHIYCGGTDRQVQQFSLH